MNQPQSPLSEPAADSLLSAYHTAFASSSQGFCLLQQIPTPASAPPDFRYLLTNSAFDQLAGLTGAVGKTIRQLDTQLQAPIIEYYESVARTGKPVQFDTYVTARNAWMAGHVFRVGHLEPPRIGVLLTNITERKRREADLAFLADVSQDLAQLTNIDETMNALGEKIATYLGLSACVFGEFHRGTAHAGDVTAVLSHGWHRSDTPSLLGTYRMEEFSTPGIQQLLLAGKDVIVRDVFADPRTDGPQYAAINVGSFVGIPFVRDGNWRFLLVVYRSEPYDWSQTEIDLTRELLSRIWTRLERALAEEALRLEDRRKDEFMAMLGHELRNPLATLYNTLLLLTLTKGEEPSLPLDKALAMMSREVGHLTRMVDDLLDVSRIRQGKIPLRKNRLNLNRLVAETLDASQADFTSRHQLVIPVLPQDPVWVSGDATRLTQVVRNLLTNAAKYTPARGQIRVILERQGDQAQLQVADTGIGLAADQLVRIFNTFEQVVSSLDRPQGGLGLGLAVVKQLVEQHGGTVLASSQGLGQGSQFTVTLPVLSARSAGLPPAGSGGQGAPTQRRILVVDDNSDLAHTAAMLLRLKHFEAHTRLSGEAALAAIDALNPDAVLLDLGMPLMDGYETARRLRLLPWGQYGKIVALTGYGQAQDKQRTRAAGFDGHLVKPIDLTALTTLLIELLA